MKRTILIRKKWFIWFLAILFISTCFLVPFKSSAEGDSIKRQINLVYDNSGSMYNQYEGGRAVGKLDTWCQAKYSMEVFASMLGENDTLNIYYMSDYRDNTSKPPQVVLNGSDGAAANIAKIHTHQSNSGETPFNSVRKAYSDLIATQADEKWLVVLTDGVFNDFEKEGVNPTQEMDNFFGQKSPDVKVMYLGMGSGAKEVSNNPANNIYYEHAETNNQILEKITDICTRIFNTNKLVVDASSGQFSMDVPMKELTIFAQGENVSIKGIKGETSVTSKSPLEVKYSECDAPNRDNEPTKELMGKIETFTGDFVVGDYTADVSGAKTIEIYYKPNIEVAAYLTDKDGNEVTDMENLEAGEYTINFGFVKAGTDEKVEKSDLLGDVKYEAQVENNGQPLGTFTDGDTITIEEGNLAIDASASYMDYNSVSTHLDYQVYKNKIVTFEIVKNPQFTIEKNGFANGSDCVEIKATVDGRELTKEEWDNMETPTISLESVKRDFKIDNPRIEKGEEIGQFKVYPVLPDGKPSSGEYTDCNYTFEYGQIVGIESWRGILNDTLKISDVRPWWQKHPDWIIKGGIAFGVFLLLIGYIFKRRLPKNLKRHPKVNASPKVPGLGAPPKGEGKVEKNAITVILPFIAERATIRYVPKMVSGATPLKVRATGGQTMKITNASSFPKNSSTKIGSQPVSAKKGERVPGGISIHYENKEWKFSCNPTSGH